MRHATGVNNAVLRVFKNHTLTPYQIWCVKIRAYNSLRELLHDPIIFSLGKDQEDEFYPWIWVSCKGPKAERLYLDLIEDLGI